MRYGVSHVSGVPRIAYHVLLYNLFADHHALPSSNHQTSWQQAYKLVQISAMRFAVSRSCQVCAQESDEERNMVAQSAAAAVLLLAACRTGLALAH